MEVYGRNRRRGRAKQDNSFACWFFDYDNDGWPDLFVAGYSTESKDDVGRFEMGLPDRAGRSKLYRNMHDGTFKDVTAAAGLDRAILPMAQTSRPGQRRVAGCLSGHRRFYLPGSAAQPHVPQRRGGAL